MPRISVVTSLYRAAPWLGVWIATIGFAGFIIHEALDK
jgi:hypothetical protein